MKLTTWRLIMLVGLGLILSSCATTAPRPAPSDLVLADPQGRAAAWIEPSGKVHYAPKVKPDAVIVALVKSIAADRATLAEMRKTQEAVEKKAAAQRKAEPKKLPKPSLLKDERTAP